MFLRGGVRWETGLQIACSENREDTDLCFLDKTGEGELRGHGVDCAGYGCGCAKSGQHM